MRLRVEAAAVAGLLSLAVALPAAATTIVVAESGGDFSSIQAALDAAGPGDTIQVREKATPYFEKLVFSSGGDASHGFLTLEAFPGEHPVLDGTGVPGANMVLIQDRSWVRLIGFEIRNDLGVKDGSGVRVIGSGSHIEIRDNEIHDIRGRDAMGITVYGTGSTPISDLVIDGNLIHDCEPARSEALTLNGNVTGFEVTNNVVRDVNNIGIDFIGGETEIQPDPSLVARNGVCRGNQVIRAQSIYGGGFAGGIYVDGGRDIVLENNVVTESDLGIEVGAENAGITVTGVVVRNNVLYHNEKAGLVFGGFAASAGRVQGCEFRNNTVFQNDTLGAGFGELWIQYAESNLVRNNVFYATSQDLLLASYGGNVATTLDHNLWFAEDGAAAARFVWNGAEHIGFDAYRAATGQDGSSLFADPALVDPAAADFHVAPQSPAINAGDPATTIAAGETDLDGAPRLSGPTVDIGADEVTCGDGVVNPGEQCDDGNAIDGDGCDSNCTVTGCGNGVVTAGEACDDGNLVAGDCCDASCQVEPAGSACDDGDLCTQSDVCDGAGACAGLAEPAAACKAAGRASLLIRDRTPDSRDLLVWRWVRGAATDLAELGDPVAGGTGYSLCLYDRSGGVASISLRASAPAGGLCGGKPCWKATGATGYRYKDSAATPDGLRRLVLRAGPVGKAKVIVQGRGAALGLPPLPLAADPDVTVQLRAGTGACWGAVFPGAAAQSDGSKFKARAP